MLLEASNSAAKKQDRQVRTILEALQQGRIERSQFTANANSYFGEIALKDYKNSLAPLGKLELLTRAGEQVRGGMTHLTYRGSLRTEHGYTQRLLDADGKFEQFLVEEQI